MIMISRLSRFYRALGYTFFLLSLAACGGLAGEPQLLATVAPPPTTTPVIERGYPQTMPDLARGAQLYARHCTQCHGPTGRGDGPLVQSGQVGPMRDFTDPDTTRGQKPSDWYATITNGRLEKLMPPWRDALTEQERWDVAMYTYTMAYTADHLSLGRAIWERECAACHGAEGVGDGPEMPATTRRPGDLSDPSLTVFISDSALYTNIAQGIGEHMPAYQQSLSADELSAVVAYTRTLSLQSVDVIGQAPPPAATEEATTNSQLSRVSGRVTNGTAGGSVPQDLVVYLRYGDLNGLQTLETVVAADGTFSFADVPLMDGQNLLVYAFYRERLFTSVVATATADNTVYELPLTIYELTEDPFVVTIQEMTVTIESLQVENLGNGLVFTQRFIYRNTSDRAFSTSAPTGNGVYASLLALLPPGSVILNSPESQRYLIAQQQYALIDTMPVLPGDEHEIVAVYFLPYEDGAIIEQPLNNALLGPVTIYIRPTSLSIIGSGLAEAEPLEDPSGEYKTYSGALDIGIGDVLRYEIRGLAFGSRNTSADASVVTADALLPFFAIVGLAVIALGGFLFWRGRKSPDREIDRLVRMIAELDAMHEAGKINHDLYRRQRAAYKAQLARLLGEGQ